MMATAEANCAATLGENTSEMAELTGSAVLVVIGEPFTGEHKELILERITKGFRAWDEAATGCDINAELSALANSAPTGEDGPNGEVIVQYTSAVLSVTVLINPQCSTVVTHLRQLLLSGGKHRHLLHAGHAVRGTGDWLLQDDCFTYDKFAEIVRSTDIENALKQQEGGSLDLGVLDEGGWKEANLAKQSFSKLLRIRVNPPGELPDVNGILQFSAYLTFFVKVRTNKDLLKASDVVGNIRFSRPTLYIFPGAQGDSALFGISGFNLLVNGGYARKSCFWDFTRHLDRIDAVVNTHLGADNFMGLAAVLERKASENVHPEISFVYMNAVDKPKHSPDGDAQPENGGSHKPASLLVSLVEEGNKIVSNLKQIGQAPSPCVGRMSGSVLEPITLYHKVGHGTLDMFVLNPVQDSKELKEFLAQWNKDANSFSMVKSGIRGGNIPLPNVVSICALLVWRPAVPTEKITRILFPGSAPQSKIFEGLDKIKNMDIFQHETCSEKSLHAPKASNKKAGGVSAKSSRTPTPRSTPVPKAEPKNIAEKKASTKVEKGAKDETNKKALEKKKKSPSSSKSTTPASMTPSQSASQVSSPQQEKVPSPVEPPKEAWPEETAKIPSPIQPAPPAAVSPPEADIQEVESAKPEADQVPPTIEEQMPTPVPEPEALISQASHSPEPLPDPTRFESAAVESSPAIEQEVTAVKDEVLRSEPVEVEAAPVEKPAAVEPEPLIDMGEMKEAAIDAARDLPVEAAAAAAAAAVSEPPPAPLSEDRKSLEDLGIYDDEKDVDTAEITHSAASLASSQAAEDQGLGDEEPESLRSPPTEPLVDFGVNDKTEVEQPIMAAEAAPSQESAPPAAAGGETEVTGAQQPEADQMVFGGAAPEGLPEPADPVLESQMAMEQNFLEQMQKESSAKEADMPAAPELELATARMGEQQEELPRSALEPEVELAQEPALMSEPDIELAEEPRPEDEQQLEGPRPGESEPVPVVAEPAVEMAMEPVIETAPEPELEVAQEPSVELQPEESVRAAPVTPEPEPEVELAQKAELHEPSEDQEPLEIATKAEEDALTPAEVEDTDASVAEPAVEAEEAPQPDECKACDERKIFPDVSDMIPDKMSADDVGDVTVEEPDVVVAAEEVKVAAPCEEKEVLAKSFEEESAAPYMEDIPSMDEKAASPLDQLDMSTQEITSSKHIEEDTLHEQPTAYGEELHVSDMQLKEEKEMEAVQKHQEPEMPEVPETKQSPVEEVQMDAQTEQDLECKACDERDLFPGEPPAVDMSAEVPEIPEKPKQLPEDHLQIDEQTERNLECKVHDDRNLFPDEPAEIPEIPEKPKQSPVEDVQMDAQTEKDLECKACDERNLFPDEPAAADLSPSPLPQEVGGLSDDEHAPTADITEPITDETKSARSEEPGDSVLDDSFEDDFAKELAKGTSPLTEQAPELLQAPVEEAITAGTKAAELESEPQVQRTAESPEVPSQDVKVESPPPLAFTDQVEADMEKEATKVEQSLVERTTAEEPQVAQLEDLPTPSEPSVSEQLSEQLMATDQEEDSSAYDKEHDGDDDSLLLPQQHAQSDMEMSMEGSLPLSTTAASTTSTTSSNNPFDIIDGPNPNAGGGDPMSMSFFDDGAQTATTNPFLGMEGGTGVGLPAGGFEASIPQPTQDMNQNPFDLSPGLAPTEVAPHVQALRQEPVERDSLEREEDSFDPLKEWGQPMGLPAPAPPAEKAAAKKEAGQKKPSSATAAKKPDPKRAPTTGRPAAKKAADADSKTPAARKEATAKKDANAKKEPTTPRKEALKKDPVKKESPRREPLSKPKNGPSAAEKLKNGTGKSDAKNITAAAKKDAVPKLKKLGSATRPATAPAKSESAKSEPTKRESPRPATASAANKRPATTSKPPAAKAPTPTPVVPFYVDLTYVPCHGDMHCVDLDFFRRVRARYYVISALNPSPGVLNALLEAKQTWDKPDAEVTLIPTYDTETLRHWMGLHRDQLSQLKIDVAPSASRCTIQLQDHETSCAAYRLEF